MSKFILYEKKFAKNMKLKTLNEVAKSICKIKTIRGEGTGFFLKIGKNGKQLYILVTAHHVVPELYIIEKFEIINDNGNIKKIISLNSRERIIEYFPKYDITAVEIIDKDNLKGKVKFLNYDSNCIKEVYKNYLYTDVFTLFHPYGNELECSSGIIIKVEEPLDFEFKHNLDTYQGSSGSPILLFEKLNDEPKVIGVHTSASNSNKNNIGSFIDVLINKLEYKFIVEKKKKI